MSVGSVRTNGRLSDALPRDVFRALVASDSDEGDVAHVICAGPLQKLEVRNEFRLDPDTGAHLLRRQPLTPSTAFCFRKISEWAIGDDQWRELRAELAPHGRNETSSDAGRIDKLLLVVEADNQTVQSVAAWSESADDELLAHIESHLRPGTAPFAGFVERVQTLCDDTFAADASHAGKESVGRSEEVLGVLHEIRGCERRSKEREPFTQRQALRILSTTEKNVEDEEHHVGLAIGVLKRVERGKARGSKATSSPSSAVLVGRAFVNAAARSGNLRVKSFPFFEKRCVPRSSRMAWPRKPSSLSS